MGISAEWVLNKLKQRIYAVSHAKIVVRNQSTVDKDLTTLENQMNNFNETSNTVQQVVSNLNNSVTQMNQKVVNLNGNVNSIDTRVTELEQNGIIADGTAVLMLGKANNIGEVTIPIEGWVQDTEKDEYYLQIENSAITERTVPVVAVSPDDYDTARDCELKPYCKTSEGILRIYAGSVPSQPITASIALIGGKNELPLATSNTAGVVKPGTGFQVDSATGALNVDTNVVITNDDMVDEEAMTDTIKNSLQT